MKNQISFTLIGFILLLIVIACDGVTMIRGRVIDENRKPIQKVQVRLVIGDDEFQTETDRDGKFHLGGTHAPMNLYTKLSVSLYSYEEYELELNTQEKLEKELEITLKKKP